MNELHVHCGHRVSTILSISYYAKISQLLGMRIVHLFTMSQLTIYLLSFLGFTLICALLIWLWQRSVAGRDAPASPVEIEAQTATIRFEDGTRARVSISPLKRKAKEGEGIEISSRQSAYLRISESGELTIDAGRAPGGWLERLKNRLANWPYSLSQTLFAAGLLLYAVTRLIGITEYPIFFFTDEAVQTNLASDFIRDNFRNYDGELFPTYFENVDKYSLSLTVYAQIIPFLLFGKSVLVTRATAALLTVLAAYWLSLILRDIFKLKYWWTGGLLLAISPAWFLHSRTAFETCLLGTLYAGFLYYYMRYRQGEPKKLYTALALGALAFYSYNPGRVVVTFTGLLLLLSDIRYHWQQRKTGWRALLLLVILALPFLRFYLAHPTAQEDQLRLLASYWMTPVPLNEKLTIFLENYWQGLGPGYWFIHNEHDLVRHQMDNYPHLLSQTVIFAAMGVLLSLRWIKRSEHRTMLLALIAAPTGSALVSIGITRIMVYIIPAVLLIGVGLDAVLRWLARRGAKSLALTAIVFVMLGSASIGLTADALINGDTWSHKYGLSGMQFGARQLYGKVLEFLDQDPETRFYISPNWTNGANVVARFFLPDPMPVELGSIDGYARDFQDDIEERTFVIIPEEYDMVVESGKFTDIDILDVIPYPDGRTGFYFLRLTYSDAIDDILARELEERKKLIQDEVLVGDEIVHIRHSQLDMGDVYQLFDQDPRTVTRTDASNPYEVELIFPKAHEISGISLVTGSAFVEITVDLYAQNGEIMRVNDTFRGSVDQPEVSLMVEPAVVTQHVSIQVRDKAHDEPAHVHLWEITFEEEE